MPARVQRKRAEPVAKAKSEMSSPKKDEPKIKKSKTDQEPKIFGVSSFGEAEKKSFWLMLLSMCKSKYMKHCFSHHGHVQSGKMHSYWFILNDQVFVETMEGGEKGFVMVCKNKLAEQVFKRYGGPKFDVNDDLARTNLVIKLSSFNTSPGSILNQAMPGKIQYSRKCQEDMSLESYSAILQSTTMTAKYNGTPVMNKESELFTSSGPYDLAYESCKSLIDRVIWRNDDAAEAYKNYAFKHLLSEEVIESLKSTPGAKRHNMYDALCGIPPAPAENTQQIAADKKNEKFEATSVISRINTIGAIAKQEVNWKVEESQPKDGSDTKKKLYSAEIKLLNCQGKAVAQSKKEAKTAAGEAFYQKFQKKYTTFDQFKAKFQVKKEK